MEEKETTKKPYTSPELQEYGSISELTMNTGPKGADDNGGGGGAGPKTS
jgi:hypothetical protein